MIGKEQYIYFQDRFMERLDKTREVSDEELAAQIDCFVVEQGREHCLDLGNKEKLRKYLLNSLRGLDVLQDLLEDENITEIMVNGPEHIFVERGGKVERWPAAFTSGEKLENVIQQIVAGCNRVVNEASPIVDARLSDGSRVNIVMNPVALNGPIVTIRRFPEKPVTMEQLLRWSSISQEAAEFLKRLVKAGYNIFISGGTGSGKTTLLNVLSQYIPREERVITIEDNAELQLQGLSNLVRLETRNSNVEGCREITIRELIRTSLRMRPDRIIVGEVRGAEAIDMLQCMNSGHDGSMSTGHANSGRDMLSRLENMVLMGMEIPLMAIRQQVASAIDVIVHLGRLRDKSRRVLEITEVLECRDNEIILNPLFVFEEAGEDDEGHIIGKLQKKSELLREDKLKAAGLL
mgnify:CR=1 FL=1